MVGAGAAVVEALWGDTLHMLLAALPEATDDKLSLNCVASFLRMVWPYKYKLEKSK